MGNNSIFYIRWLWELNKFMSSKYLEQCLPRVGSMLLLAIISSVMLRLESCQEIEPAFGLPSLASTQISVPSGKLFICLLFISPYHHVCSLKVGSFTCFLCYATSSIQKGSWKINRNLINICWMNKFSFHWTGNNSSVPKIPDGSKGDIKPVNFLEFRAVKVLDSHTVIFRSNREFPICTHQNHPISQMADPRVKRRKEVYCLPLVCRPQDIFEYMVYFLCLLCSSIKNVGMLV